MADKNDPTAELLMEIVRLLAELDQEDRARIINALRAWYNV